MNVPNEALDLFEKARTEIEEKRFNEALTNLLKSLEIYSDYAEALSLVGYVHYKLKFKKMSKEDVYALSEKALKLNKNSPIVWLHMGNANSYLKKFDEAILCYKKSYELGYENEKLYNNLGSAYLKKGEVENALEQYIKGLSFDENYPPLLNNLGYCYATKGELDKALQFLEKALESDPNYSAPINNLGNLYNEIGDYDKALEYYFKVLEIEPDDPHALNNLGTVYFLLKNYEEAIKYFKKAIEISPDYGDPWLNLGAIYSEKLEYEKANEHYDKALQLDSSLFKAWYNKGNAFNSLNDIPNAITSYKESIKINKSYSPAWGNLGVIFSKIQNFPEAENCFKKALEINQNSIIDLFNLGNVYRLSGEFGKSIEFYQKAIELNPIHGGAWYNQGISYLMIEDFDMAINCLEEATHILPKNSGILGNLGMAYQGKREFNKAINCFSKVLEINSNDVLALNRIGQIYIQINKIEKALPFLKKALEIEPSPLLHIDKLGYEYYQTNGETKVETKKNMETTFPYTPDIYTSIGMAYHQLGNNNEAINYIKSAIESDPGNFIGYANLGIIFLNMFNFSNALREFDKAINLINEKGLKQELEKVKYFKDLTERALQLKPNLRIVDEKIALLIKIKNFNDLNEICLEIKNSLKELLHNTNITQLPIITKDLLLAKSSLFETLYNIINFTKVDLQILANGHNLFSSKTEFFNFFFSFQNFKDITNLLKGYKKIEEIPEVVINEILNKISLLESLGSKLSDVITGSIVSPTSIGESSPLTDSRRTHSGIEIETKITIALSSDKENDYKSDDLDLLYIKQICEELHEDIPKYKGNDLKKSDFIEFIGRFPQSLRKDVAKLLKRTKFVSFEEMSDLILKEVNNIIEDPKNAYIISLKNGWQKSQEAWTYFTKKISGESFKSLKIDELKEFLTNIKEHEEYYFIFLDDVIGTGSQFVDFIIDEIGDVINDIEEINKKSENVNFYLIAGLGSFMSKRYISKKISLFKENTIRFGYTIRDKDRAFSEHHFSDRYIRDDIITFLKEKHPMAWNGYNDSQYLVILEWNTPDNTIGCLRKNTNDWKALFPRN